MQPRHYVCLVAVGCITLIEVIALAHGINGKGLAASVGCISLVIGYTLGKILKK